MLDASLCPRCKGSKVHALLRVQGFGVWGFTCSKCLAPAWVARLHDSCRPESRVMFRPGPRERCLRWGGKILQWLQLAVASVGVHRNLACSKSQHNGPCEAKVQIFSLITYPQNELKLGKAQAPNLFHPIQLPLAEDLSEIQ